MEILGKVESFTSTLKGIKLKNNETIFNSQYNLSTKCSPLDEVKIVFRQSPIGSSVFIDELKLIKKATEEDKKAYIEIKKKKIEQLLFNNIKVSEANLIELDRNFSSSDVASLAMFLTSHELRFINI